MPEVLLPETLATILHDFDRRIRTLESAERVGLNRIRMAWNTAAAPVGTFDAWYTGPAGAAWEDDRGNTGTGYPRVTVRTGRKALVMAQGYADNIANDAAFRTYAWALGIGVDGATPPNGQIDRYQTHGPTTEGNNYVTLIHPLLDLVQGEHTFYLTTKWYDANPGAPNLPRLDPNNTAVLAVIPLDL